MNTQYVSPRFMLIGGGTVAQLSDVLAKFELSRPLIVTDPFMVRSGLLARLTGPLETAGIVADVFSDTIPEPTDAVVVAGVEVMMSGNYDCLVGFGGGSPIDTAKAMAILAPGTHAIRALKVPHQADRAALPVIAVPTTAGTGSEATRFTVITDVAADEKMLIAGLGCLPLAAIVDYELTFSVPPRITADTGIDSLTHALEAYVSRRANPFSDAMAVSAMRLIGAHLRTAYREPDNAVAREAMMLGATQAGIAFTNASVALVHGMSRPIGARFHVPHGLSNAMLLPAVTRFGLESAPARYAEAARQIGFCGSELSDNRACDELATQLDLLCHDLAVPTPRGYGIDASEWEAALPKMAEQALASGSPANNPRMPSADDIIVIYRSVYAANT